MTDAVPPTEVGPAKRRRPFPPKLRANPVLVKELRSRMRGGRAFLILTGYLTILAGFAGLVYILSVTALSSVSLGQADYSSVGIVIFGTVVLLELLMVCFISPALTAGSITTEREQRTFELVSTTLLTARALVMGKLGSALSYLFLLLFVAFPLQALAYVFGGVAAAEVLISAVLLVVTALATSALGLFFSSSQKRTLTSTVLSYAVLLLGMFALPIILAILLQFVPLLWFLGPTAGAPEPWKEAALIYIGVLAIATNPLATAFATETLLFDEQKVFFYTQSLGNGVDLPVPLPWIPYTIFYLVLTLILIRLSIRWVRRAEP